MLGFSVVFDMGAERNITFDQTMLKRGWIYSSS